MGYHFFMEKNSSVIKFFLKAKRPEGLRILMLQNNAKSGAYHDYRVMFAEGFWYAWYDGDSQELIREEERKLVNKQ